MRKRRTRLGDGHSRKGRRAHQLHALLHGQCPLVQLQERATHLAPCQKPGIGTHPAVRRRRGIVIAFQKMPQCIHRRVPNDMRRRGRKVFTVNECQIRKDFVWKRALCFFGMKGQYAHPGHLGPGAAGCRNQNQRKMGGFLCLRCIIQVIRTLPGMCQHKSGRFRGIQGRAAADPDDKIRLFLQAPFSCLHNRLNGGVLFYLIKQHIGDTALFQSICHILQRAVDSRRIPAHHQKCPAPKGAQLAAALLYTVFFLIDLYRHIVLHLFLLHLQNHCCASLKLMIISAVRLSSRFSSPISSRDTHTALASSPSSIWIGSPSSAMQ